jgi:thiol-disulfide isomerase/thioredoxin
MDEKVPLAFRDNARFRTIKNVWSSYQQRRRDDSAPTVGDVVRGTGGRVSPRRDGGIDFLRGASIGNGASHSGFERNYVFLSRRGTQFADVSGISGLDSLQDSRALGLWDYDRDGWTDVAIVNANAPWVQVFRNQIGAGRQATGQEPPIVALRFVGANVGARSASTASNRDGYGALVKVTLPDRELVREHRCGEGFAGQNSATMLVGLAGAEAADRVNVRWPSGVVHEVENVPRGALLVAYEDPSQSPSGSAFVAQAYAAPPPAGPAAPPAPRRVLALAASAGVPKGRLNAYTTMATWCESCKKEQPQVRRLRAAFSPEDLGLFGVPVDEADTAEKLAAYLEKFRPGYVLVSGLPAEQVAAVKRLIQDELKGDALPATVVTDATGKVLLAQWGAPTVSDLRRLLSTLPPPAAAEGPRGRAG